MDTDRLGEDFIRAAEAMVRRVQKLEEELAALQLQPSAPPAEPSDGDLSYTLVEAAVVLKVGRTTLWRAVKAGEIPTFTWMGKTFVRAEDLRAARDRAFARQLSGTRPRSRRPAETTPRPS